MGEDPRGEHAAVDSRYHAPRWKEGCAGDAASARTHASAGAGDSKPYATRLDACGFVGVEIDDEDPTFRNVGVLGLVGRGWQGEIVHGHGNLKRDLLRLIVELTLFSALFLDDQVVGNHVYQIGRASCRERGRMSEVVGVAR